MAASHVIKVKLDLETQKFSQEMDSFGTKLSGFGKKFALGAAALGGGAIVAFQALSPMIDAASDLSEEVSKAETIFGPGSKAVADFAETAAKGAGMSKRAATEYANTFGQFGKAAGLGGDDLAAFGTEFTQLAADLASFNNLSVEEAAQKLSSGLAGEAEPLRQMGILFNAADVEAKGLEMGLGGLNGKLTDQEKILARQALIFEKTTDAQGDFARTSDGLANQQRIMAAQWENVQIAIGTKLLPVMLTVVTWINEKMIPALSDFGNWLETEIPAAVEAMKGILMPTWVAIQTAGEGAFRALSLSLAVLKGDWNQVGVDLGTLWDLHWKSITAIQTASLNTMLTAFGGFGGDMLIITGQIVSGIIGAFEGAGTWLYEAGKAILTGLWDGMKAQFEEVAGWVKGLGGWFIENKGPPAKDAVLLVNNGELIMKGLGMGMQRGFQSDVVPLLTGVTAGIPSTVGARSAPAVAAPAATPSFNLYVDGVKLAQAVADGSRRAGGIPLKLTGAR